MKESQHEIAEHALDKTTQDLLAACWSDSTKRAYRGDVADFTSWGGQIPASMYTVLSYITQRSTSMAPATLRRRLVGISMAHVLSGFEDPAKHPIVTMTMRGARRTSGTMQRRARPLLHEDLWRILPHCAGQRGLRDRAMLLLGFSAALRRSELTCLNVEDTSVREEGLYLSLAVSKTDQERRGRRIAVPRRLDLLCPVRAFEEWLVSASIKRGPIFRAINKSGNLGRQLSAAQVGIVVKKYAALVDIDPSSVSGHSLRSGFATSAAKAGASLLAIRRQTGHHSLAMLERYIHDSDTMRGNANTALPTMTAVKQSEDQNAELIDR